MSKTKEMYILKIYILNIEINKVEPFKKINF